VISIDVMVPKTSTLLVTQQGIQSRKPPHQRTRHEHTYRIIA
jgi:hypothetical protein